MKSIASIVVFCFVCTLTLLNVGCNVVGNSTPEEARATPLDSLSLTAPNRSTEQVLVHSVLDPLTGEEYVEEIPTEQTETTVEYTTISPAESHSQYSEQELEESNVLDKYADILAEEEAALKAEVSNRQGDAPPPPPVDKVIVRTAKKEKKERKKTVKKVVKRTIKKESKKRKKDTSYQDDAQYVDSKRTAPRKQIKATEISKLGTLVRNKDKKLQKEERQTGYKASSLNGKSVTICITGVDSRLGVNQRHADANHILRIWLETGFIEVFSVPRGTPIQAGFKSKSLNYLANLRSNKGREAYLAAMSKLTGVGKIDYWVEFGFSQAMGVIELLGFKDNAVQTLRVLRTRKAYAIGDYQRCYNQGQFIRQMLLRHFTSSSTMLNGVTLRGALNLVETNMKYDVAKNIVEQLQKSRFPQSDRSVTVAMKPHGRMQLREFDLSNEDAVLALNKSVDKKLVKTGYIGGKKAPAFNHDKYTKKLEAMIARARKLVHSKPSAAVSAIKRPYEQRAWIQVQDDSKRKQMFREICLLLIEAYEKQGFIIDAENVRYFYETHLQTIGTTQQAHN